MRSLFLAAPVVCLAVLASPAYPATAASLVVNSAYAEDGVLFIENGAPATIITGAFTVLIGP
jgi:hypothetical protein